MRLLIADILRRKNRWLLLLHIAFAILIWWWAAELGDIRRAFVASVGLAFVLGPDVMVRHVPRPIWYLPVSRRDVWRASWFVAAVGATLVTAATKIVALTVPSVRAAVGPAGLLLSVAYDFAATGVGCALIIIVTRPRPSRGLPRRVWPVLKAAAEFLLPLGIAPMYASMFFNVVTLPARWSDLTPPGLALLLAALALTLATYFHTPRPTAPANLRPRPTPSAAAAPPRFDRLGVTGLPRLLLHEYAWTLMLGGLLTIATVVVIVLLTRLAPPDALDLLGGALRAAGSGETPSLTSGYAGFDLMIWYVLFGATLAARFPSMLRHLRVLPLGAARLNALLVGWPAAIWLTLWCALALLHYAVLGAGLPASHAALFIAVSGFSALVQSLLLRLSGVVRVFVFGTTAGIVPFLHFLTPPSSPPALALFGLAAVAAAAVNNHAALSRGSTYKTIGPHVGVPLRQN